MADVSRASGGRGEAGAREEAASVRGLRGGKPVRRWTRFRRNALAVVVPLGPSVGDDSDSDDEDGDSEADGTAQAATSKRTPRTTRQLQCQMLRSARIRSAERVVHGRSTASRTLCG